MAVKNTSIFVNIIIYQTTCFGLIRPSSGWNTASEENYLFDLNASDIHNGDDTPWVWLCQSRLHPKIHVIEEETTQLQRQHRSNR